MARHSKALIVGMLASTGWFLAAAGVQADVIPGQQQGVEVLTRGPVHEAYAEVVDVTPAPTPMVPQQPPPPIEEVPPDQKPAGDNVQWIPGYWAWDQDQSNFIWVSGIWRATPPDRQWVPGHWQQVAGGWQWVPGLWMAVGKTELQILPPPPASLDQGPSTPAPDAMSTYVPGCWVYQVNRYLWRPGFWVPAYPDWIWTPAHYVWTPSGCIFVDGFWDRPLEARGLLFAPVVIDRRLIGRPNWHFTPHYVVRTASLLDALFVGPSKRHYYFGDYFEPRYQKLGYVSWLDHRIGTRSPDPLYSYYRHRPEGERWERDVRELYTARRTGRGPLPPRTLVQQNQLITKIGREPKVNKTTIDHLTVVHPLPRAESPGVKLTPVPREQHVQVQKSAEWYRQVQQQRQAHEAKFVPRTPAPAGHPAPVGQPAPVRTLTIPQAPHPARVAVKTPPPPAVPKHVEKPR